MKIIMRPEGSSVVSIAMIFTAARDFTHFISWWFRKRVTLSSQIKMLTHPPQQLKSHLEGETCAVSLFIYWLLFLYIDLHLLHDFMRQQHHQLSEGPWKLSPHLILVVGFILKPRSSTGWQCSTALEVACFLPSTMVQKMNNFADLSSRKLQRTLLIPVGCWPK